MQKSLNILDQLIEANGSGFEEIWRKLMRVELTRDTNAALRF